MTLDFHQSPVCHVGVDKRVFRFKLSIVLYMHSIRKMQINASDHLLSAADITEILGVSKRTFESIVKKGDAPSFLLIGRQRRWRRQDVASWIDSQLQDSSLSTRTWERL